MKKVCFILVVLLMSCDSHKSEEIKDILGKGDYTMINGVAVPDTFGRSLDIFGKFSSLKVNVKNEKKIVPYIDPGEMDYVDWFLVPEEFRLGKIVKSGKIKWDKKNKELITWDVDKKDYRIKRGIPGSRRFFKYKVKNNKTYLSKDGVKWFPLKVSVSDCNIISKENFKTTPIMYVTLECSFFHCAYSVYATDRKKVKYQSFVIFAGVVIINGEARYLTSEPYDYEGEPIFYLDDDYKKKYMKSKKIIPADKVILRLSAGWGKRGSILVKDLDKVTDKVSSEKKYKYVIHNNRGYVVTWDEKDFDELKVEVLEKHIDKSEGNKRIKVNIKCKWFSGQYVLSLFDFSSRDRLIKSDTSLDKNNLSKNFSIPISNIMDGNGYTISEYWKSPGKYSGINALDGNLKTCFARDEQMDSVAGGKNSLFYIKFDRGFKIDTIKIAAGCFFNEKYYKMNNRPKEMQVTFGLSDSPENTYRDTINVFDYFTLKDSMEYQVLKLKDNCDYYAHWMMFEADSFYKGSKYDDTCISDIKFYYKGKEIKLENVESYKIKEKNELIKKFEYDLKKLIGSKTYHYSGKDLKRPAEFIFMRNGDFKVKSNDSDSVVNYFKKVKKWKISHGSLLLFVETKWLPVKYYPILRALSIYQIGQKKMTDNQGEPIKLFYNE